MAWRGWLNGVYGMRIIPYAVTAEVLIMGFYFTSFRLKALLKATHLLRGVILP